MNKIVKILFGSHLYGTNTVNSDLDFKSIYIPTGKEILFGTTRDTFNDQRVKNFKEKNLPGEEEEEVFSLKEYFKLLEEGQTICLDMLFAPSKSLIFSTYTWYEITHNKDKLLSKKPSAFVGYCRQQAKKYGIKGSRVAAVRETLALLSHFSYPNQKLETASDIIEKWAVGKEFIEIIDQVQASGTVIRFLEVCGRKLSYRATIKEALKVVQGLMDEYGQRALLAEKNEGVDWKALSHAVRVSEQAIELFKTGNINFPRPNKEYLKRIKLGMIPYREVAEVIEYGFVEMEHAAFHSDLPESIDKEWVEDFIENHYYHAVTQEYKYNISPNMENTE